MQPTTEEVKALDGMIFAMLNEHENEVLNYYRDQGRKFGVEVSIINEADPKELAQARSQKQADQIMKTANRRIAISIFQTSDEAYAVGAESAREALAKSNKPILMMDESCDSEVDTSYAFGWNSVCVGEENNLRWNTQKQVK